MLNSYFVKQIKKLQIFHQFLHCYAFINAFDYSQRTLSQLSRYVYMHENFLWCYGCSAICGC